MVALVDEEAAVEVSATVVALADEEAAVVALVTVVVEAVVVVLAGVVAVVAWTGKKASRALKARRCRSNLA